MILFSRPTHRHIKNYIFYIQKIFLVLPIFSPFADYSSGIRCFIWFDFRFFRGVPAQTVSEILIFVFDFSAVIGVLVCIENSISFFFCSRYFSMHKANVKGERERERKTARTKTSSISEKPEKMKFFFPSPTLCSFFGFRSTVCVAFVTNFSPSCWQSIAVLSS